MKRTILVLLLLIAAESLQVSAQTPNLEKYGPNATECLKYLDYYQAYYKQRDYESATPNWREAYKVCPLTCSQNMLINGTTLIKRLISLNSSNKEYKNALLDSLFTLYDQRAANYPKYAVKALNDKGKDLFNYVKKDSEKLFNGLESVITANQSESSPTLFLFDMNAAIDLFKEGKLDMQKVIDVYQRNSSMLEASEPQSDAAKAQKEKIKSDLGNIFVSSNVANCESLQEIYGPKFAKEPDNLQLVKTIVKTLGSVDDCTSNKLFLNAVTAMNKMEPTGWSSYYLYKLTSNEDNVEEAISHLETAIASNDTDDQTKAGYLYELATYCYKNGKTTKAYEAAKKVPALDPLYAGKAYFLMGNIWSATTCAGDEIKKRSQYWVAVDFYNKAKAADESLAEDANTRIKNYSQYFPQQGDAFFYGISDGQSYTVSCNGLTAVTTVRTIK